MKSLSRFKHYKYLERIWESIGVSCGDSKKKIRNTSDNIVIVIQELYKVK